MASERVHLQLKDGDTDGDGAIREDELGKLAVGGLPHMKGG